MKFYLFILLLIPLLFFSCEKEEEECIFFLDSCDNRGCSKNVCCESIPDGICVSKTYDCRKDNICFHENLAYWHPANGWYPATGKIYCSQEDGKCYVENIPCSTHQECISQGYKHCYFNLDDDAHYTFSEICTDFCHYEYSECTHRNGCQKANRWCSSLGYPYEQIDDVELNCNEYDFCIPPYAFQNLHCNPEDGLCYPQEIPCTDNIDCQEAGFPELICDQGKCLEP